MQIDIPALSNQLCVKLFPGRQWQEQAREESLPHAITIKDLKTCSPALSLSGPSLISTKLFRKCSFGNPQAFSSESPLFWNRSEANLIITLIKSWPNLTGVTHVIKVSLKLENRGQPRSYPTNFSGLWIFAQVFTTKWWFNPTGTGWSCVHRNTKDEITKEQHLGQITLAKTGVRCFLILQQDMLCVCIANRSTAPSWGAEEGCTCERTCMCCKFIFCLQQNYVSPQSKEY